MKRSKQRLAFTCGTAFLLVLGARGTLAAERGGVGKAVLRGTACDTAADCDDKDGCTTDTCTAGQCVHAPRTCDDRDDCTLDECSEGACENIPIVPCRCTSVAQCNDEDACTQDSCVNMRCQNVLRDCGDRDNCTDDFCEDGQCFNIRRPGCGPCPANSCDDLDLCTTDACRGGICIHTPTINCNDNDDCTEDFCLDGKCVHSQLEVCPCDSAADCDDEDACTTDTCVATICVFTPGNSDDGNACTEDFCIDGKSMHLPLECEDEDPCTTNSCDPESGCTFDPRDCDDNNPCTTDTCDRACIHTPIVGCTICNPLQCPADTDPCTDRACIDNQCANEPIDCEDDDGCTDDSCVNGACMHAPRNCDDGVTCTADSCDGASGNCRHQPPPGMCAIGGMCYSAGAVNPANDCQKCDPAMNLNDWTPPGCFSLRQFADFQNQFTGEAPPTPVESPYDLDGDGDIDLGDFAELAQSVIGP